TSVPPALRWALRAAHCQRSTETLNESCRQSRRPLRRRDERSSGTACRSRALSHSRLASHVMQIALSKPRLASLGRGTRVTRNPVAGRPSHRYEICVCGRLGELMLGAFPDFEAHPRGEDTALIAALPDQAALHGVLAISNRSASSCWR